MTKLNTKEGRCQMKYKCRMVVIDVDQGYLENISAQLMERIESVRKKDERIVNITRESSVTDQISYFVLLEKSVKKKKKKAKTSEQTQDRPEIPGQ